MTPLWFFWILVAWFTFNGLAYVALIGRPRKAITPADAVGALVGYVALIAGLFLLVPH